MQKAARTKFLRNSRKNSRKIKFFYKSQKIKWYILFLVPAINIFMFLLLVVETANTFHRYNYFEQTLGVIFPWIYLPYVGLNNYQYHDPHTEEPHKVTQARDWPDALTFAIVAAT